MSSGSSGSNPLEGNGILLVKEIALASRIQRGLENLYRLDRSADVDAFITRAERDEREALFVRETEDGYLELRLRLPQLNDGEEHQHHLDPMCQIIEGVSHFVYLANRASQNRETTQLELELQAEVDKYVVLASSLLQRDSAFDDVTSRRLRERLYAAVQYRHAPDTTLGERYRVANDYAWRFTGRLEREFIARARFGELRTELRRFFHMSQADKLRAA